VGGGFIKHKWPEQNEVQRIMSMPVSLPKFADYGILSLEYHVPSISAVFYQCANIQIK